MDAISGSMGQATGQQTPTRLKGVLVKNQNRFRSPSPHPFRNDSGVAAVEMAATMLVFLTAMFSIIEFGWFFLNQNTLTAAVRDGIRIGALGTTLSDSQGNGLSRENSIKQAIQERGSSVMTINPADILIFPVKADFTDADDPAVNNAGGAGAFMRVRVNHRHQWLFPLLTKTVFGEDTIQISSEGTYRNEEFISSPGM